ncbi:hypothetical protein [Wenjunlia tyrosinilytica]|uniref:Uncharacterized protein n=1 Tax=Wenjunlia tyrosinilytica TaxID=1544741 RepID=A0A917ZEA1_9ACTN|nr:hypothetical protein [Wenjunlia tyrosinilytica]GGO80252.1 hypothetical protein GCM10012280_01680 [Wenjunlia tyrosinilytica]
MPYASSLQRTLTALLLAAALLSVPACGSTAEETAAGPAAPAASAERARFAKTRFVANAGLAAGATYQWIVKPYKAGRLRKGAQGRTMALVKAGLAGSFTYSRLKAATREAEGDPRLTESVAPLGEGIESLQGLGAKLRAGDAGDEDIDTFENVISSVKEAGDDCGAPVTDRLPTAGQLGG